MTEKKLTEARRLANEILPKVQIMNTEKNFVVLEFYPSFTPRVEREFTTREDAVKFAELMQKSETGRHTYAVFSRIEP